LTTSAVVIESARAELRVVFGDNLPKAIAVLIAEYEIAIAQNLRLEEGIHALCKRIDELPSA
jgi:hypothetical protein